jgi:hypothetical protein
MGSPPNPLGLCNAFGVGDGTWGVTQVAPRRPAAPSYASTLGFGIQPLRGQDGITTRSFYAEGVALHSPGSRSGAAASAPWVGIRSSRFTPKGFHKGPRSIPHIAFVNLDPIFSTESTELILE